METKEVTLQRKIDNAVKWIEALPSAKQPTKKIDRGRLGDETRGFCCLGVGCHVLDLSYDSNDGFSNAFVDAVGLLHEEGKIINHSFYKKNTLAEVNDETNAGFKRIATFIKTKPQTVFTKEVAEGIKEHYNLK